MIWVKVCLYFCPVTYNLLYLIFVYNIFIFLFQWGVRLAAIGNAKAKQWIAGRKNIWSELEEKISKNDPLIWIHASSAGEFEQAKPVIEELKLKYPSHKIAVSFFSSSGFIVAKKYIYADLIFYLPVDTSKNAKRLITKINPQLVIFVKYDLWYHYLNAVHRNQIPLLLVAAVFRKKQSSFQWYGSFFRKMLGFFTQIFVQDKASYEILKKHDITQTQISGDTRFDRVGTIAGSVTAIPFIKEFIGENKVLIAGSTWPDDEALLKETIKSFPALKIILVPHEVNNHHIKAIQKLFPGALLYSQLKNDHANFKENVLVIDNVGILSKLYQYATIAYVGGGFTRDGIHNILEAAVFGRPVIFGPNHKKYREAKELIDHGGGVSVATDDELISVMQNLLSNNKPYQKACEASHHYIHSKKGATKKIIDFIQEKRLLTN